MPNWSDLYQLGRFEQRWLVDLFDFYEITEGAVDANKRGVPATWPHTPTYALVPCRYVSTDDMEYPTLMGQQTTSNFVTQDLIRCHILQPCSTNWLLVNKILRYNPDGSTYKHPLWGQCWIVQGEGKNDMSRPRMRAYKRRVFAKPAVPPPGFSISTGAFIS